MAAMAFLEIDSLTYAYPESSHRALDNINLQFDEGEMVLLLGGSGSGKSTLLRALCRLIPDFYGGAINGSIRVGGQELDKFSRPDLLQTIGIVYENPENQLVMTTVGQELAFGLENLGIPAPSGHNRLGEVAEALGLTPWLGQSVATLSGGQKQKTVLAAVLAMRPRILLLDEPSSRLDPVASEEVFNFLRRLNEENGLTIIMAEHRLERCYHFVDRVVRLEEGHLISAIPPQLAAREAVREGSLYVPPIPQLFAKLGSEEIPLTVKQAKICLGQPTLPSEPAPTNNLALAAETKLAMKRLSFAYPGGPLILKKLDFNLPPKSITALMGANGSGKSTLGKCIMGLLKPQQGDIYLDGSSIKGAKPQVLAQHIGYLPQETGQYFFLPTVQQEIEFNSKHLGVPDDAWYQHLCAWFSLVELGQKNPRDLSRGEQQKIALACVLLAKPALLLLDEPTQGLDPKAKQQLGTILMALRQEGIASLLITHDIEFVAEYADRVAFLQQGALIGQGATREMICGHTFYSPQINRLLGGNIITVGEALVELRGVCQHDKQVDKTGIANRMGL